ncbi:MAG TPA: RagB/SusD family nutrient uptake outer membrane protein [Tenuifilaceae bacterium]|nr:RagB/SusD family nutrient uptake outer membrane protein [Tenuifilaceae bacterium]
MKKINKFSIAAFLLILLNLTACSDFLDTTPKGNIIPKTVDDFGMMLDDATDSYGNYIAYGTSNVVLMDDDIKIGMSKESKLYSYELAAYHWADELYTTTQRDYDYSNFYKVIYICNYIIQNIEKAPLGDGKYNRDVVYCSALFHRANAYLNLVNIYAKQYDPNAAASDLGVPLMLEADPNLRLPRASVEKVYNQILTDAHAVEAMNALPDEAEYSFRPTNGALYAMLMRIYLYMGNYEKSNEYAIKARNAIGTLFDYNELEIWDNNPDLGVDGWVSSDYDLYLCPDVICYKNTDYNTFYYFNVSDDLLAIFDRDADLRFRIFITKYECWDDAWEDEDGLRISTIYDTNKGYGKGEVYITEAETALRLHKVNEALESLNELRKNRFDSSTYSDVTETDPEKLMKIILEERRRELMFKGLRWFDLKRLNLEGKWGKTVTHVLSNGTYTLSPNDARYIVPIPQSVIDANPLIKPNIR